MDLSETVMLGGTAAQAAAVGRLASAALLAGGIVLLGACYALFLALSRLQSQALRWAHAASLASYAGLAGCVIALALILEFNGLWLVLAMCLLVGYFVLPRFIWRLTTAVHEDDGPGERS